MIRYEKDLGILLQAELSGQCNLSINLVFSLPFSQLFKVWLAVFSLYSGIVKC